MVESGFRPADRPRAIGAWAGLSGVAGALGPLVGGVLVGAVSWRAVFLINLRLGIFIVVMAGRHVPETRDPAASGRLDVRGATLAAIGPQRAPLPSYPEHHPPSAAKSPGSSASSQCSSRCPCGVTAV
jgi:MFS family permease